MKKFEAGQIDKSHLNWVKWERYTHTEGNVENSSQQYY